MSELGRIIKEKSKISELNTRLQTDFIKGILNEITGEIKNQEDKNKK